MSVRRLFLNVWHGMPDAIRLAILRVVQPHKRVYRWLVFQHAAAKDRAAGGRDHLPSPELRYRVGASPDAEEFIRIGRTCAVDIQKALQRVGADLGSVSRVLDFGCGCGRVLVHMKALAPGAHFDGIDIDAHAIAWCRQHLAFASFALGQDTPPAPYPDGTFDLIYVISVFTHLDEDYQFRWLAELERVARPGGTLLVTVNGLAANRERGFVFERTYEEGLFPAWYQNTYHARDYVFTHFGKYFDVLEYLPQSLNAHQDIVILQKRRA